jgi:hypothetical protein
MSMTKRKMVASAFAAAAVLLGGAGTVAVAHTLGGPAASGPAVAPADHLGQPGAADRLEPGDKPDQPTATQTPDPEDGPDGPGDANEGPGE